MNYFTPAVALAAAGLMLQLSAQSALFDPANDPGVWNINPGIPGCAISRTTPSGKLRFTAKFNAENAFVGFNYRRAIPVDLDSLSFTVQSEQPFEAGIRVVDATGRNFQTPRQAIEPGKESTITVRLNAAEWDSTWGGNEESTMVPKRPLKDLMLIVNRPASAEVNLTLEAIRATGPTVNTKPFTGEEFSFSGLGCTVTGTWRNGVEPVLTLTVDAAPTVPADTRLAVTFPSMYRDDVQRFTVTPGKRTTWRYQAPLQLGGNPCNTYDLTIALEEQSRVQLQRRVALKGADSPDWHRATPSREIEQSIIGTGAHFCFALEPEQRGADWGRYEELMDLIADAGIKWIRDELFYYYESEGMHPQQLAILRAAKERGLKVTALLPTFADRDIDRMRNNVGAIVKAAGDLIDVYEIGNEPPGFGQWDKKYPGAWNGNEADGSTSTWVTEHARYTGATADYIRQLRPDAVIITGGAVTPANLRYIRTGFGGNIDGYVDHLYNAMLPPEQSSFGALFEARDGVRYGDRESTHRGITDSYQKTFEEIGRPELGLWLTEFGYTSYVYDGKTEQDPYKFGAYTEEAQAAYLVRRYFDLFTMPTVKGAFQYDFLNDGTNPFEAEHNFGLVRADFSRKPAYFAIQRLATLFNGVTYDPVIDRQVTIEEQPLVRSAKRERIVDWDNNGKTVIPANNSVFAHLFPTRNGLRLAVWSGSIPDGVFANRTARIRIAGQADAAGRCVGIDMVTGRRFDVPTHRDGDDLILNVSFKNPITIALF